VTSIRAIADALPARRVDNAELDREHPEWRMELVSEITGVRSRRFAAEGETALDLSVEACRKLLDSPEVSAGDIDAILYCTLDPDHPMPGNAQLLHRELGLGDRVLALDYRLACSGYVYGLGLAHSLAAAGLASGILLVTAETQSKRMHPGDRSLWPLLGDGAAATFISADDGDGGRIVACDLRTHGRGAWHGYTPAGGARIPASQETKREEVDESGNVSTPEHIHMDGVKIWSFVSSIVPGHVEEFLAQNSLSLEQIDLCVFHQGSELILNSLAKLLGIPREKVFTHMSEIGNLSSASIPFALRAALEQGAIQPGYRVLLTGFGAGISYGSAIVEY
jgi:3-oxoacyl-[acyl-carrier-protein] synthase III